MATSSTTNYHFPYPLGSDSLSNVALRIQELAEYIDSTYTILGVNLAGSAALMQVGDAAGGALTGTYPNPTLDPSVPLPNGMRATTQAQSDNSTKVATTAYVDAYIAGTLPDGSVGTTELANGAVTNAKVNAAAAIAYSKLALSNSITNSDVSNTAAIAYSKLNLANSIVLSDLAFDIATQAELDTHTSATTSVHGITNTANLVYTSDSRLSDQRVPTDGSVTNAKVAAGAAIAYSKLNLTGAILNADLAGSIAYSKLSLTNSIVNGDIVSVALAKVTGAGTAAAKDVPATGDASATQVVLGSDTRLTNSRTPTSHASTHASAGSDPITISPSQVTGTAVITTDSRLSDARTPTTHAATHVPGGSDAIDLTKIVGKGGTLPSTFTLYPAGSLFALGAAAPYLLYRSTGTAWEAVGGSGGSISVSDTAPAGPSNGNLWFDSTTGKTFIWYTDGSSNQWVEVGENAQVVIPGHGSSHVRGGSDVIDGDRLQVDYTPTNYTANTAAAGAGASTDLTAHLAGLDAGLIKPNIIINGRFAINQRSYTSGTALSTSDGQTPTGFGYGFDRWKALSSGASMTFTAAPQGQQVTIAATHSFGQIIERANVPAGTYVLSWTGTSQGRVYNAGATAPSYAASPVVVTLDGTANVVVQFNAGTLDRVKFEAGGLATPFVQADISDELRRCQRYFYRVASTVSGFTYFLSGTANNTTDVIFAYPLPVIMRTNPTASVSATTDFVLSPGNFAVNTFVSVPGGGGSGASSAVGTFYTTTTAAPYTAGQSRMLVANNNATAALSFSAEL